MTVPTYDYDKRHWKKIYGPEELNKIAELLTGIPANEIRSSTKNKPTVRIRRMTQTNSDYYSLWVRIAWVEHCVLLSQRNRIVLAVAISINTKEHLFQEE